MRCQSLLVLSVCVLATITSPFSGYLGSALLPEAAAHDADLSQNAPEQSPPPSQNANDNTLSDGDDDDRAGNGAVDAAAPAPSGEEKRAKQDLDNTAVNRANINQTPSRANERPEKTTASRLDPNQSKAAPKDGNDDGGVSSKSRSMNLRQLGIDYELTLRGTQGSAGVPFGVRTDELVQSAILNLKYSSSPALLPDLSHLRVAVNGVTVDAIPLQTGNQSGKIRTANVSIDPRLITAYNRIDIQLVAHYSRDCENPDNSSLWANIDASSTLTLNTRQVALANELSLLPVPFFDPHDTRRLELPFYFAQMPEANILESAGIVASYFGALAGYRGATFPVSMKSFPSSGNAVMVSKLDALPKNLTDLYPELAHLNGPGVAIIPNPKDSYGKLLLVLGKDAKEIRIAASALALHAPLAGSVAAVDSFDSGSPRKPYDAPNWISDKFPVRFGDLVDQNAQTGKLSVTGYQPEVIRVGLQLPPDLFVWGHEGVPVTLKYRYTVPTKDGLSALNISINEAFVTSLPLDGHPSAQWPPIRWWNSLSPRGKMPIVQKLLLPTQPLSSNSQLKFHFLFDRQQGAKCSNTYPDVSAAVDGDSTIDISDFPHYLAMPNLAAFGNAGFPFTRLADLAETVIVLPNDLTPIDVSNTLTLLGRFGALSGFPTVRVNFADANEATRHQNADFLILGSDRTQPLLSQWKNQLPIGSNKPGENGFSLTDWLLKRLPPTQKLSDGWDGRPPIKDRPAQDNSLQTRLLRHLSNYLAEENDFTVNAKVSLNTQPGDVVVMGFESPLKHGRSVIAIESDEPSDMQSLFDVWFQPQLLRHMQGSVVLLREGQVNSLAGTHSYYVGELPMLTWWRWYLPNHPVWLAVGVIFACLILGWLVRIMMRIQSAHRLRHGGS